MSEPKPTKEPIQQRAAQDSQANQQKNEQSKDNQAMDDASRAKSPLEEVQGLQARIAKSLLEDIQELQARIAKKAMDDATRAELLSKEVERLQERITKRNDVCGVILLLLSLTCPNKLSVEYDRTVQGWSYHRS